MSIHIIHIKIIDDGYYPRKIKMSLPAGSNPLEVSKEFFQLFSKFIKVDKNQTTILSKKAENGQKPMENGQFGSPFLHVIQKMILPASQSTTFSNPIVCVAPCLLQ